MATISFDNIKKPANKKWKSVSKFLTRTLPIYAAAIMPLPISDEWKLWITFFATVAVATISALSEFTTEEGK